ncbi:hypothetical protein, partial [Vibrio anguillarum]|uniref:hypothetical protein n=1 Tax=Vibrio anguillarum TaxID=55601 RepID=UPI00188BAB64
EFVDISALSSIPTDSLYKFMSISGLFVLLISIVLPFKVRKNYQIQVIEFRKIHDLTSLKIDLMLRDYMISIKYVDGVIGEFGKENAHLKPGDFIMKFKDWFHQNRIEIPRSQLEELVASVPKDIDSFSLEIAKDQIENECELKKVELVQGHLAQLSFLQVVGVFVGMVLTVTGFYMWYEKVQVFIDATIA